MEPTCFTCQTIAKTTTAPGGIVFENEYWLADHCVGAFGVGAIVLKTKAHRENVWELTPEESQSLGDALKTVSGAIVQALRADRVYVSLWVDQRPYHVHFVLQPRYPGNLEAWGLKGLKLQLVRWLRGKPNLADARNAAEKIREFLKANPHP
jgi:diadenosine tetraphosphate (Ap4A) HIT family hydrolase